MVRYSFPVGLFHPLPYAGLSRRTAGHFVGDRNETFSLLVEELEIKFQVRLRPLPPGPPAKKPAQAKELSVEIARQVGA